MGKQVDLISTGTHGPIRHGPTKDDKGQDVPALVAEAGDKFTTDEASANQLIELGAAKKAGGGSASTTSSSSKKTGPLPEDFPGRTALEEAGIDTYAKVRAAGDLTKIPGIGEATADKIAEAVKD